MYIYYSRPKHDTHKNDLSATNSSAFACADRYRWGYGWRPLVNTQQYSGKFPNFLLLLCQGKVSRIPEHSIIIVVFRRSYGKVLAYVVLLCTPAVRWKIQFSTSSCDPFFLRTSTDGLCVTEQARVLYTVLRLLLFWQVQASNIFSM